jgi:tripeptide aminopeptidase
VQTASRNTERMQTYITTFCEERGMTVRNDDGNIYVTKGQAKVYPCIVAHTDTVHSIIGGDKFKVYESDGVLFGWDDGRWEQAGVGGDDKCGVYIALALLDELPACKAAFFRDEEIGCLGAAKADFRFFDDCAFALQADRRGADDVVVEACGDVLTSDEFNASLFPMMSKYGKTFCRHGAMTDVQDLKSSGLGICAINASAGYHAPHTSREVVVITEVMNTKRFFRDICLKLGNTRWLHEAPKRAYGGWSGAWNYGGSGLASYKKGGNWTGGTWSGYKQKPIEPIAETMRTRLEREGTVALLNGKRLEKVDGFATMIIPTVAGIEGAPCPTCWQSELYFDYAEEAAWCNSCGEYPPVIIEELEPESLLALPAGEGES